MPSIIPSITKAILFTVNSSVWIGETPPNLHTKNEYKNAIKFINKMSKKELVEELLHIFDYAPEWVYNDFIKRNDIEG